MESFSCANASDEEFLDALYAFVMSIEKKKVDYSHDKYIWTPERSRTFEEVVSMLGVATCTPQQILRFYPDPEATRQNISSRLQKVRNALQRQRNCKGLENWHATGAAGEAWKSKDFSGFSEEEILRRAADTWMEAAI